MNKEQENFNEEYMRAAQRLEELKAFYSNIVAYVVVIPFLIFVNYMTYWDYKWFWYPMIGWGIGVIIHGFATYGFGSDWERKKIKELMEKDKYE